VIVSFILAMDAGRGIGQGGVLPWRLSTDMKRFKNLTMGHHLIMGRVTYESIGRPLPGRIMIVISRKPDFYAPGCLIVHSIDEALHLADTRGETEAFIIGGGEIFSQSMSYADRLHLTEVHTILPCDTFFPEIDLNNWQEIERSYQPSDSNNEYPSTYRLLNRPNQF